MDGDVVGDGPMAPAEPLNEHVSMHFHMLSLSKYLVIMKTASS
jgi:hypothetical protein